MTRCWTAVAGAVASLFGFIHSEAPGFCPTSPWFLGRLLAAAIFFIRHQGNNSWFKADKDFEYV
ncbi:MAG: hypothetical protein QM270_08135 [Bacillota bacterium]|nr:hypothetical protein [Bacillota bacterium]